MGAGTADPPNPAGCLESFMLPYAEPSWTLAVETVISAWLTDGLHDAADDALERLAQGCSLADRAPLTRASLHLLEARVMAARGADTDAVAGLAAVAADAARQAGAPRWEREARAVAGAITPSR